MSERDPRKPAAEERTPGPELRLIDRRAFVGFPKLELGPGATITDFTLQIPDVTFPFNVSGGATRYQKKKLLFGTLELSLDAERLKREVAQVAKKVGELDDLKLHFRPGYIEGQARLKGSERSPLTFKVSFDGDGERLCVYVYDVRLYGYAPVPSAQIPVLLARAVQDVSALPDVELKGASGFTTRVLPELCRAAAVSRGFKLPDLDPARLTAVDVSGQGLRLRFSAGGTPPPAFQDEELLLALEGSRAFSQGEALIALGKLTEARDSFLRASDAHEAHPFAAERLLSLLVADPSAHELALDVAATLLRRREKSPAALWGEAVVREKRGELARAAERYLALASLARKNQEEAAAFYAAEAAARAARDQAPQVAARALHEVLGLKPDHLPALRALARASDQANDRAGAIRAYRRMAALARDPAEAAEAHVQLARLCALTEDDVAGARLHCEAALRLAPDHPEALYQLGELCHRSGEHLRGIKSLDRLREVALARHELDRVGAANLLAGRIWEEGLKQVDNALLRYREAVALLPGNPEAHFLAARAAETLGQIAEAVTGYQQAAELAGPAPTTEALRRAAHQAHHALAKLLQGKLKDPARAREHLEAALALDPKDSLAIDALLPVYRSQGKADGLAELLEKAAGVESEGAKKAALWAEAGELCRARLAQPERSERLFELSLEADPRNRLALEGMLAVAEGRRDGALLCRCLKTLSEIAADPKERVLWLRRLLVAARDVAFDQELVGFALEGLLAIEPDDLTSLGELCALERRRADMPALATALGRRAKVAEEKGDLRLASAALRELSQVLESRLGRVGEALVSLEKAARLTPDPAVLLDLSELSMRCDRPDHARRALEDVLSTLPAHASPERLAEVHARLGRACEKVGDLDAARRHLEKALPLRKLDDELAARLEALYLQAGRTRELSELWSTRAQALLGANRPEAAAGLWLKSARVLVELGEPEGARLKLQEALELSPQGQVAIEAIGQLAELELKNGSKLEAARWLSRKAELLTESSEAAALWVEAARLSKGTTRELAFVEKAIARSPSSLEARLRRAELIADAQPKAALEDLERVLAETPAVSDDRRLGWLALAARCAEAAGNTEAAVRHYSAIAEARPEDDSALRALAQLHRRQGAKRPLLELLETLRTRASGNERLTLARELATLSLELNDPARARLALEELVAANAKDVWAARALLPLLPPPSAEQVEARIALLTVVAESEQGEARAPRIAERARLHRRAKNLEAARADLILAASLSPSPAPLWREVVEIGREAKDALAELDGWKRIAQLEAEAKPEAREHVASIARALLKKRDPAAADAFSALAELAADPRERSAAYSGLAEAAQAAGDLDRASAALLEASRAGAPKERVAALLDRAKLELSRNEVSTAIASLEAVLTLSPRQPTARAELKRLFTAQENWEGLAELLSAEARQAPKDQAGPVFAELGAIYLEKLDHPAAAEAALRRAAQLLREDANVRRQLFPLLLERGEVQAAVICAEEAAALLDAPSAAELLREAADSLESLGEAELALRLWREAHQRTPLDGDALESYAWTLYRGGAIGEARSVFRTLSAGADFELDPDSAEAVLLAHADLCEAGGDQKAAEAALRRVLEQRPLSRTAHERLATLIADARPRDAHELWVRYTEQLHPSPSVGRLLLWLSERAEREFADVGQAAQLLRRASELGVEPQATHERLADLFRAAGRTDELMGELLALADLHLAAGEIHEALEAYAEESELAEASGKVDEALKTLQAMGELCEDENDLIRAAALNLRRAELLRDVRGDLAGAEDALENCWRLDPSIAIAQLGFAVASRSQDHARQLIWLERHASKVEGSSKVRVQLERARLLQSVGRGDEAEALVRDVLAGDPRSSEAEQLLADRLLASGRAHELAAHYEDLAGREEEPVRRAALFRQAAQIYEERAHRPAAAAAALIAARASSPDDLSLTAKAAELLHAAGRPMDAAEFDAILLEADPLEAKIADRHLRYLWETEDFAAIAALHVAQAEKLEGEAACNGYLLAASAFRRASADERARLCEERAFETWPASQPAFVLARNRVGADARKLAAVLQARAEAVPGEAPSLLLERAQVLSRAGEALLAAEAYDALLMVDPSHVDALLARAELAAEAGGPLASQPYDRRAISVAGESLPAAVRVKTQLRLGHASLAGGAFRDATDALEAVVAIEPEGPRAHEALSLLAEVHARTQNAPGLYRTTLRLARGARSDEAEALYRRAADLFDDPVQAIDALVPLASLRPADLPVVDRTVRGLQTLGRADELVSVLERSAQAVGGTKAAELLLQAAIVAGSALHDPTRAQALTVAAGLADPSHPLALRAVADHQRVTQDAGLDLTLERLTSVVDAEERVAVVLERAQRAIARGELVKGRALLEELVAQGASSAGYRQALESLDPVLIALGDAAALVKVRSARAELEDGKARAELLVSAAQVARGAGLLDEAAKCLREAISRQPSKDVLLQLAEVLKALGQFAKRARALTQAASLAPAEERSGLLIEAAQSWEDAGDGGEARDLLERVRVEHPEALSAETLAARFAALGDAQRAFEIGYPPALAAGEFARAVALAEAAKAHDALVRALWEWSERSVETAPLDRVLEAVDDARRIELLQRAGEKLDADRWLRPIAEDEGAELALRTRALELFVRRGAGVEWLVAQWRAASGPWLAALRSSVQRFEPGLQVALYTELAGSDETLLLERLGAARKTGSAQLVAEALDALAAVGPAQDRAARLLEAAQCVRASSPMEAEARIKMALTLAPSARGVLDAALEEVRSGATDAFLPLLEKARAQVAGETALTLRDALIDLYAGANQNEKLYALLGECEPTRAVLERRAKLAGALGRPLEALGLREQLTDDAGELEDVLADYLELRALPQAQKLATRLWRDGRLSSHGARLVAERFSNERPGAPLACEIWPTLLRSKLDDVDGWTVFAEALERVENDRAAQIDAFGAVLSGSTPQPSGARISSIARAPVQPSAAPEGVVSVDEHSMPRLSVVLRTALAALGAPEVRIWLHAEGGVEAYLVSDDELVLGAGALAVFGPFELGYLLALALALGDSGRALTGVEAVEGFAEAAAKAYAAVPATGPALKVVAYLDASVRGTDPAKVELATVLKSSKAFEAIALKALELV